MPPKSPYLEPLEHEYQLYLDYDYPKSVSPHIDMMES